MTENHTQASKLLRLPKVLELIPVSKSSFWDGVKTGRYPKPVKISPNISAWYEHEIIQWLSDLRNQPTEGGQCLMDMATLPGEGD
jgi:predicted DNA-binding transcriptional regulator AlpA